MSVPLSLNDLESYDLDQSSLFNLLSRLNTWPEILRRQEEEAIIAIVEVDEDWLLQRRKELLGDQSLDDYLQTHQLSESDFELEIRREKCLKLFSEFHFGAGLEELFLAANGGHDQIIYSLMRVKDTGLARELWIRLEEGESTFSEIASKYGEGPEASRLGVIGPTPIGSIYPPELATLLRSLKVGEIHPPRQLGDWIILIRLEQITPSRLDASMRDFLLRKQLNEFLDARVKSRLSGIPVDTLNYHP